MKMNKFPAAVVAVLSCSAVFLSSCVYEMPVYRGGTAYSYSSASPVWTEASYDANGFPIFGYYGGRPVYGYTAEGVAIFTFAALTAACLVPLWAPAPWYHGHWHYPHHIHRVSVPPHCPHDHHPAMRPHGGLHAPIHKNPHQVLQAQPHHMPQQHHNEPQMGHSKPQQHHNAPQMGHNSKPQQHHNAPQVSPFRPAPGQTGPVINRREQSNHAQQHHMSRPGVNSAPQQPVMNAAPSLPQSNHHASAPSMPSAPSAGSFGHGGGRSNASFGGGSNRGHGGGLGGHHR